jgi:peptidoglycan/xylan/chitin deacetylase (PgdA/CDA1 family)
MEQTMATSYPRDMIGYGPNPPNPQWPNGARLALNFVLTYEEGSEASFADGDGYSESTLTESGGQGVQGRDLAAESMYEYGSRVGFWRIIRLFQARHVPLTIFGCALALERNPLAAQAIVQSGYDVCCHGWRWEKHYELNATEERERIHKAIASLQQTMGTRPSAGIAAMARASIRAASWWRRGAFSTTPMRITMSSHTGSSSTTGRIS